MTVDNMQFTSENSPSHTSQCPQQQVRLTFRAIDKLQIEDHQKAKKYIFNIYSSSLTQQRKLYTTHPSTGQLHRIMSRQLTTPSQDKCR